MGTDALQAALSDALGQSVVALEAMPGGAGGHAYVATLGGGTRAFVKHSPTPQPGMFEAEAMGLRWLEHARAVQTPEVLAVRDVPPAFIVERLVVSGPPATDFDAQLGRALATLHRAGPPSFGLARDNFIGPQPQPNAPTTPDTFATFYRERRLRPLTECLAQRGALTGADAARLDHIADTLAARIPEEPPARLHGDLWSGNVLVGARGGPVLIDPAVYGGHREIDLAMMRLFGGFSARVFEAYQSAFPLVPGHDARVPLLQLYPLLVHVALFGDAYVGQLRGAIQAVH